MFSLFFGDDAPRQREPRPRNVNFGDDVRRALANAREETIELGHRQVETEHILLGLLRDRQGEAARALAALGVAPDEVWQRVSRAVTPGRGDASDVGELPYASAAKRVLELTMDEANVTGAAQITQRHLLAGLLRERKGTAAQVLAAFGVTLDALRGAGAAPAGLIGIRIDDASDQSIHEQIVAQVQEAAATGRARPGERLPSVRALADELDIAPGTVARAYAELERRGVVVTDGARGTRIAERTAAEPARVDDLAGLIRPVVVAAYHQGATAADLRAALDRAMAGIYPTGGEQA
ncbi:MAG TPA: Clp protease N-terminal domain-containing protein [Longimicrobium sp.]|nr:Clp protease N-terminal domain-containing protein [Longimicrobium sp.]